MRRRFIQLDGELVEVTPDYRPVPTADFHVMPDIKPYQSMITGEMIGSRSTHREHLRQHGCVEVGNDPALHKPYQGIPDFKAAERKEMIRAQIANMRHDEFKRMLRNDLTRIQWESRDRPKTGE